MEEVNDELDKLGIPFVFTDDKAYIATLKLDAVPMIGMFRNGDLLQFDGSIENREAINGHLWWGLGTSLETNSGTTSALGNCKLRYTSSQLQT